jgi:hypothetical protein
VTPFFNWSPSDYSENGAADWIKLLPRRPEVVVSESASAPTSVKMGIVGAIMNDYVTVGPDDDDLAWVFCVTRNAEHDEAVSVRSQILMGASPEQIKEQLRRDAPALDFDIQSALYYKIRKRQARVLLRGLNNVPWGEFLKTLEYLRNQPRTRDSRV